MKLVFCSECGDLFKMHREKQHACVCGQSWGYYNKDGDTVTVGGKATVIGILNTFFMALPDTAKRARKKRAGYASSAPDIFFYPEKNGKVTRLP